MPGCPSHALLGAAAALACAARAAPPRSARIIEVGQAATEAVPTCPANPCLAVSRTTGYQAKVVDSRAVYVVPAAGKIVAFTIRLGAPNKRQIKFFEDNFGKASAGLSRDPPRRAAVRPRRGRAARSSRSATTSARPCSSRSTARCRREGQRSIGLTVPDLGAGAVAR